MTRTDKARLAAFVFAAVLALIAARCGREIDLGVAQGNIDGGTDVAEAGAGN